MRLLGPSELAGVGKTPFEAGGTDIVWESFDGTVMGFLTVIRILRCFPWKHEVAKGNSLAAVYLT